MGQGGDQDGLLVPRVVSGQIAKMVVWVRFYPLEPWVQFHSGQLDWKRLVMLSESLVGSQSFNLKQLIAD